MEKVARIGRIVLLAAVVVMTGCAQGQDEQTAGEAPAGGASEEASVRARVERVVSGALQRYEARADSIREILRPVSLLRSSEKGDLRRYLSPQQLAEARQRGVARPADESELAVLEEEGDLVRLEDTTAYWTVRELNYSHPLVIPDVKGLLTEIGRRFQERLAEMGLPPFRIEVSSALRTTEDQNALRGTNPNAARSASTHEFGTTIDVAYSSYAAPQEPVVELDTEGAPWLEPYLRQMGDAILERAAARKSRELEAILGRVLQEIQQEGKVMVTYEERQPVYHMTVAQSY